MAGREATARNNISKMSRVLRRVDASHVQTCILGGCIADLVLRLRHRSSAGGFAGSDITPEVVTVSLSA